MIKSKQYKEDKDYYYLMIESTSIYPLMRFISKLKTKRCIKHNGGIAPIIKNTGTSTLKIIGFPKNENSIKLWEASVGFNGYQFDM